MFQPKQLFIISVSLLSLCAGPKSCLAQKPSDPGKGSLSTGASSSTDASHSLMGKAFDQGPRQQAHLLQGIGNVHFPITTKSVEAQRFFDQGVNMLYSFFWFEAERSFRQAAMLDPDCAMAYWGMAMADNTRGKEFIALAEKKKEHVTDRERRYIEALAINYKDGNDKTRTADNLHALEQLVLAYPDDLEAKAMYAWELRGPKLDNGASNRVAVDSLLKAVIAKNPLHPGANHYRIHLWDGSPEAKEALDSCRAYTKAVPNIGHAQHMPGHIYSQVGMWVEAAYSMDSAARVERKYFYEAKRMPWESWNYGHDQDFLIANLGYTGRIQEGLDLSQELMDAPHDPQFNGGADYGIAGFGKFSRMRMLVRGERWDQILKLAGEDWGDSTEDKTWKSYSLGLASLGKEDKGEAHKQLANMEKLKAGGDLMECARFELRGRLMVSEGDNEHGLAELQKASDIEKAKFKYNDPPPYPRPLYESLAWGQIAAKRYIEAALTLREGLKREPNNGFALCLLVDALTRAGKRDESALAMEQLSSAWKHADANLPPLHLALSHRSGLIPAGLLESSFTTPYPKLPELEKMGPSRWKPFPAADFALKDSAGKTVRLADLRGHNAIVVFYLGGACLECMKKLDDLGKESKDLAALDTKIYAVSADGVGTIHEFLAKTPNFPISLLSDPKSDTARKFFAYDEFEKLPLHGTFLINREGKVWWFRTGSEPFSNAAFLKKEIPRMESWLKKKG